jgi:superfamily II DNA or RNA helicase
MWTPYIKYPKVSRYVGVNRLVKQRNDILVRMRFEKETIRHTQTIWVDYDQELWDIVTKERWNPWRDRPIKDAAELFSAMRRVANGHDSRVRAVEALLSRHSALIVFYSFNYELEALRALNEKYFVAEWNGHKHEEIPDQEAWVYLVQYTAGSEGWNCTSTNAMAFYSLTSSYKKWEQAHGRIDRLNTSFIDLYYYIFRSKTLIDTSMWRSMKAKKDFNYRDVDLKMLDWN